MQHALLCWSICLLSNCDHLSCQTGQVLSKTILCLYPSLQECMPQHGHCKLYLYV